MPNYRQKQNKKKNNKNRNKNKNQQQQNPQQDEQKVQNEKLIEPDQTSDNISEKPANDCASVSNAKGSKPEPANTTLAKPTENTDSDALNNTKCEADEKAASKSRNANSVPSDDTVFHGTATHAEVQLPCSAATDFMTECVIAKQVEEGKENSLHTTQYLEMGGKISKDCLEEEVRTMQIPQQAHIIVHRVIQETESRNEADEQSRDHIQVQHSHKEPQANAKVIISRIVVEAEPNANNLGKNNLNEYHQKESTKQIADSDASASKTEQNDEVVYQAECEIQIQEVSDTSSGEYNTDNPPIVCEMESEPEIVDETFDETDDQISESILSEDVSLYYSQHDDLKQRRVQKRAAIESHFLPQYLSPRYLDSIVEENSDMSDARSDCSDNPLARKEYNDDLKESDLKAKKANAIFPKSNLDFSKKHKHGPLPKVPTMTGAIREEPQAIVVETKLIEQTHAEESCSRISSIQTPESEAPEIVYINSASSSISDLMDLDLEESADKSCSSVDLDTDFKEIITTPSNTNTNVTSRESTPVNQTSQPIESEVVPKCAIHSHIISTDDKHVVKNQNRQTEIHECVRLQDTAQLSSVSNSLSSGSETRQNVNDLEKRGNSQSFDTTGASTEILTSSNSNSLSAKHAVKSIVLKEKTEMDSVRDIINGNSAKHENVVSDMINDSFNLRREPLLLAPFEGNNNNVTYDLPPPIPPPPPATYLTSEQLPTQTKINNNNNNSTFTLGTSFGSSEVTEPELPDFNPSKKPNTNSAFIRQESADSHCSDSTCYSQCTAINMAQSPLRDFDVMSPISDYENSKIPTDQQEDLNENSIKKLRLLCAETLSSMPYGEEVLEELANVSQNIGEIRAAHTVQSGDKMPYPLPVLPHISDLQLSICGSEPTKFTQTNQKLRSPTPPPVPEPPAKYNDSWLGLPSDSNPKLLVCLSPSQQQSYINDNKMTSDHKPDQLLDAHQKFIERRGYHEYSLEQVKAMDGEKLEEEQILKTAAIMKKLRKSLTPPPIPPPPVPSKSSKTAAKAQNKTKTITAAAPETTTTTTTTTTTNTDNDASFRNANDEADGEENRHRLLAIIHNTNETIQSQTQKASSFENSSRQSTNKQGEPLQNTEPQESHTAQSQPITVQQKPDIHKSPQEIASLDICKSSADQQDSNIKFSQVDQNANMQSVESELANMFPSMGHTNIFDSNQKRFSNIESFSNGAFCSQLLSTQPKRFSNIETSSFESKKEIRNGEVVYDVSNFKRDSHADGDETLQKEKLQFPFRSEMPEMQAPPTSASDIKSTYDAKKDANDEQQKTKNSPNAEEIMSALKLNTENFKTTTTMTTNSSQQKEKDYKLSTVEPLERRADIINRQQSENTALTTGITSTYEEFRQRAKTAAEAASSSSTATATSATLPSTMANANQPFKSTNHFDHENLFKDFDELSKQLHMELESGKAQREQREKSASLYDLSRTQMQFKHQFDDLKKQRHEHMKELELEIERSMRSRKSKSVAPQETTPNASAQGEPNRVPPRTFEIPIQLERDYNNPSQTKPTIQKPEKEFAGTYNIPIQVEPRYLVTSPLTPRNLEHEDPSRFRRAESMFNISDNASQQSERQRTTSINYADHNQDDWSRYASDLGSSENIARPFAREVKICYQRQRPQGIRAPRLTASTNNLSANSLCFDSHNAYNVRRTHAPMLSIAPQQRTRPQYLSCTSMIERDPNPTYISTTSRRGVSPAPPPLHPEPPLTPTTYHHDQEQRQRRASLPREIHEQQLKYIINKEDELKTEFERLQNERHRLMEEMNRPQIIPTPPQRPMREVYRPAPKLPTLSEDEVFRQQMAEEWLNKVAEREERRLQKIIKMSKINEHEGLTHEIHQVGGVSKPDISEEFLHRVKERRSKLAMPSDSDWESGAESHPLVQGHASETEEPTSIKIIEGKTEADLRQMPRHLREFAKFSNHQNEKIDGGNREVHQEEERRQEVTDNSISSALKKSSVVKTVKISRHPAAVEEISGSNNTTDNTKFASLGQGQVFADLEPLSTTTPTMPFNTCTIPQSPFLTKLPASFDEMFATSPFRNRIYEEFDNYWRSFDNNTS